MPVRALPGCGPVLLVIDNGWASAGEWPRRVQAANSVLDRAERAGRQAALLTTAPDGTGATPQSPRRCRLPTCVPGWRRCIREPWPLDRAAAAAALQAWHRPGTAIVYSATG